MENNLSPKLRFPEFKGNWEEKKFNSLYSFKSTNSFSRENLNYENGEVKNIHYGDIHTKLSTLFDITKEKVPFINLTIDTSKIKEDSYVEEGDLIIADASENYDDIGKMIEVVNVNDEKLVAGLHTFLAKRKNTNNAIGFTANLVKTWNVRQQILKIAQGTKVLSISTGRLGEILLTIPQPEEQQKIASFLTSVDERLKLLAQQKEKLELYKKGVMQQIFPSTSSGQAPKLRFKDENGNNYPDWEEKKLGEIAKITIGEFIIKTKQNPNSPYPVFNGGKSYTGFYDDYNNEGNKIIISARGANAGFVNFYKEKYWAGNSCYSVSFKAIDNYFIEYFFYYVKFFENRFTDFQQAANIPSVSKKDVENFKTDVPCLEEQQKIASFLLAIDVQIEGVSNKIEQTKLFKKGLLQQMFV